MGTAFLSVEYVVLLVIKKNLKINIEGDSAYTNGPIIKV